MGSCKGKMGLKEQLDKSMGDKPTDGRGVLAWLMLPEVSRPLVPTAQGFAPFTAALQSCCWLQLGQEPHMLLAEPKSGVWWVGMTHTWGPRRVLALVWSRVNPYFWRGATPAWHWQDLSLPPSLTHIFSCLTNLKCS